MSPVDDGGPAFPSEGEGHGNPKYHSPGMTLRDWFAGQALVATGDWAPAVSVWDREAVIKAKAVWAYEMADEMLKVRQS